jgi:hypothetical protein
VTNTGDETLKILNDPRGPLSKIPTDTFVITDAAGSNPDFTGVRVKYVPENVLVIGKEDAFTILAPGVSAEVEHDCMIVWEIVHDLLTDDVRSVGSVQFHQFGSGIIQI